MVCYNNLLPRDVGKSLFYYGPTGLVAIAQLAARVSNSTRMQTRLDRHPLSWFLAGKPLIPILTSTTMLLVLTMRKACCTIQLVCHNYLVENAAARPTLVDGLRGYLLVAAAPSQQDE